MERYKQYKQYIDLHWWAGIEKRDIDSWVSNFDVDRELPRIILEHIVFYNVEQLKAYTRVFINKLKNEIYMECVQKGGYSYINDDTLFKEWKDFLRKTSIMPAAREGDSTGSAYKVISYWRSAIKNERCISDLHCIEQLYQKGIRRFIFVDDFSGSGKQMTEFLKTNVTINERSVEIGRLPNVFPDIKIVIALYVIHEKSKKELNKKYPDVKVMAVDMLDDKASFLNENSYIYNGLNKEQTRKCVNAIQELNNRIMDESNEFRGLSSYVLNIPIVFEHGCPNNALLLLFAHTDNWKRLFKRGNEK